MIKYGIIIVAGGSSIRMGAGTPKQFLPLGEAERPVLAHTIEKFADTLPQARIVVALPPTETGRWAKLSVKYGVPVHIVCEGGETRFHSVKNALAALGECELVAIHDGVRPLVSKELIIKGFEIAETYGTAIPAIRPVDSFRKISEREARQAEEVVERSSSPFDRELLRSVQTPQVFRYDILINAYETGYDPRYTDDAAVVEAAGTTVTLFPGDPANIKITNPVDLIVASTLIRHL